MDGGEGARALRPLPTAEEESGFSFQAAAPALGLLGHPLPETATLPLPLLVQGKFFSCNDLSKMTEEECRCAGSASPVYNGRGHQQGPHVREGSHPGVFTEAPFLGSPRGGSIQESLLIPNLDPYFLCTLLLRGPEMVGGQWAEAMP